jgi:hypothetical protein
MTSSIWRRAVSLVAVAAFLITGCASMQPIALNNSAGHVERPSVNVGESVVVKTKSGQTRKFTVTSVEDDALVGKDVRVPYSEMASLDVSRAGEHKMNTGVIVGIVVGVVALAAALGSGGGGGGSGY